MKPRRLVSLILLLAILGAGVWYVAARRERFAVILTVPPAGVASLLALALLTYAIEALLLRLMARELDAGIGVVESNLLVLTRHYWNYLPMRPGIGAVAVYMKRNRGLPYSQFVAYVLAVNLLAALSRGVIGLALTVPICLAGNLTPVIPAVFAAMVVGAAGVMAVPSRWSYAGRSSVLRAASRAGHAWHQMRRRRWLLVRMGFWNTAQGMSRAASLYLCFRLVESGNGLTEALVVVLLNPVLTLAGIVPAGLGIREAVVGAVTRAFGRSFTGGVVAAALGRAVPLCLLAIVGPLASHRVLLRFLPSSRPEAEGAAADEQEPSGNSPAL